MTDEGPGIDPAEHRATVPAVRARRREPIEWPRAWPSAEPLVEAHGGTISITTANGDRPARAPGSPSPCRCTVAERVDGAGGRRRAGDHRARCRPRCGARGYRVITAATGPGASMRSPAHGPGGGDPRPGAARHRRRRGVSPGPGLVASADHRAHRRRHRAPQGRGARRRRRRLRHQAVLDARAPGAACASRCVITTPRRMRGEPQRPRRRGRRPDGRLGAPPRRGRRRAGGPHAQGVRVRRAARLASRAGCSRTG